MSELFDKRNMDAGKDYDHITALYVSATDNTKKIILSMTQYLSKKLNLPYKEIDFTLPVSRKQTYHFSDQELVLVGCPTYAGKLPNMLLADLKTCLKSSNAKTIAMVTFGNRSYDNSLAELCDLLHTNGFDVVGGAAFCCRHAFTDVLAYGRPDGKDMVEAFSFVDRIIEKLNVLDKKENYKPQKLFVAGDAEAPYYIPKGVDGQPAKFLKAKPKTDVDLCNRCGLCAKICPMASIDIDDVTKVTGICIKCQACIRKCPKGAKFFDDNAFLSHVKMLETHFQGRKENEFFY